MNATELLEIDIPLIQAGMGGVAGPELAIAVSEAGAAGVVGLYKLEPDGVAEVTARVERGTSRPYGVNLIPEIVSAAKLAGQIDAVLESTRPNVFVTFYDVPSAAATAMVKRAHRRTLVQVGEARDVARAVAAGADACILQGIEAGGHLLGTMPLVDLLPLVRREFPSLPLVASGGISSGRQLADLQQLGADGCWCGTLFVAAAESDAHPEFKERVVAATADDTVITSVFKIGWPGRRHRVLRNDVTENSGEMRAEFIATTTISSKVFPIPRYSAAVPTRHVRGRIADMAMYCGTSCEGIAGIESVRSIIDHFATEYRDALEG